MEYNIKKYQFHQNGKDYVVSTGLVYDRIRITCQENLALDGPFYSNEFSLYDLQNTHQLFKLTQTPEEALKEINKGIERQKAGLKLGANDIMHFLGYLVIGTDNDVFILNLKRSFETDKYGIFTPPSTGAADLILSTDYKIDGQRLNIGEINAGNLQREQTMIEEELDRVIPQLNKFKRISMDIQEENALIKERLRILQKKLEEKKYNVFRLKEENANLKRENQNLINSITEQENAITNKQAIQTQIQIKQRPNINQQLSAVVSKFEQPALRTFFPRTGAKPNIEGYNSNQDYNYINQIFNPPITTEINPYPYTTQNTYENITYETPIQTQTLPTIYQVPQPQPQPVIYNVQQPYINPSPSSTLRLSNKTNSSYNNKVYRVYLKSPSQYNQSKLLNPNLNKKNEINISTNNNTNLTTLTDKIKNYGDKSNNEQLNINSKLEGNINENNEYVKPSGSRMPIAQSGNNSMSPSYNKNKKKSNPEIGYSSYKPNEDNNKK